MAGIKLVSALGTPQAILQMSAVLGGSQNKIPAINICLLQSDSNAAMLLLMPLLIALLRTSILHC